MIVTHPLGGLFKGNTLPLGNSLQSLPQAILPHFQLSNSANLQAIKLLGKLQNRSIPTGFHLMQDMTNRLIHLMIHTVFPSQKLGQRTVKVTVGSVQSSDADISHFVFPDLRIYSAV